MLDVAGQDASEAFEDVGHSDEARETLDQLLVGTLKRQVSRPCLHRDAQQKETADAPVPSRQPGDPAPKVVTQTSTSGASSSDQTGFGIGLYAILLIGGVLGYVAFQYMAHGQEHQPQTA